MSKQKTELVFVDKGYQGWFYSTDGKKFQGGFKSKKACEQHYENTKNNRK